MEVRPPATTTAAGGPSQQVTVLGGDRSGGAVAFAGMTDAPGTAASVEALLTGYPGRFTSQEAAAWVARRRGLLEERTGPVQDLSMSASSGCATTGVHTHARELADSAARALLRWDAGLGTRCEKCSTTLLFDRLDSAPAAVRCTGCAPASAADTRWCR